MKKAQISNPSGSSRKMRPALTPEARENQLISLAVDCAEQQLRNGTASSQVITHYLKLGSTRARLELEILEQEKKLKEAKTEQLRSQKRMDEMYVEALKAMKSYQGNEEPDDED